MSISKINSKKWLSDETPEEVELFKHCKEMEYVCYAVNKALLDAETKWRDSNMDHTNMSLSNRSYIIGLVNIQVSLHSKRFQIRTRVYNNNKKTMPMYVYIILSI